MPELHGEAFNFGPPAEAVNPVRDVVIALKQHLAGLDLTIDESQAHFHEAGLLKLSCDKALSYLGWKPVLDFDETMQITGEWFARYYTDGAVRHPRLHQRPAGPLHLARDRARTVLGQIVGAEAAGSAIFTPLPRIATDGGEVMKALRSDEPGFLGIEEAYFSRVDADAVRAWKLHTEMSLNVVVPVGHVRFVVADRTMTSPSSTSVQSTTTGG